MRSTTILFSLTSTLLGAALLGACSSNDDPGAPAPPSRPAWFGFSGSGSTTTSSTGYGGTGTTTSSTTTSTGYGGTGTTTSSTTTSTGYGGTGTTTSSAGGSGGHGGTGTCTVDGATAELAPLVEGAAAGGGGGGGAGGDGHGVDPAPGMPGWKGKLKDFSTPTQCGFQNWRDTDGVAPETPGCHQAYEDKTCDIRINDVFGEACQDDDILIETNPGAGQCHAHKNGKGEPDLFSCKEYCDGVYGPGTGGRCMAASATCYDGNVVSSAYCLCGC